ncbi:LOB domain-containing protein 16-like [Elaeis guineensis]|uniref:LOB domain-containing protein 16-like n=1 Tax=Elaeis guineensis var. tenera TaxID=51953 RepID=A0A6I9RWL3_ELAGV|nr:LOB domain-containing protein 16-like [Elaeis guineensis]
MASGGGSPCGACKFLRRKCAADCVFAPYFCSEEGAARFAAIHKVFGASNVTKLLLHVPPADRCEAVVTIAYEAQARLRDPVYGCVGHIFALQQQVANLQLQLLQAKAQLSQSVISSQTLENQYQGNAANPLTRPYPYTKSMSPQSSLDCIDPSSDSLLPMHEMFFRDDLFTHRGPTHNEFGELQALASKMMKN